MNASDSRMGLLCGSEERGGQPSKEEDKKENSQKERDKIYGHGDTALTTFTYD
jgi:hypothetical protein